MDDPSVAEYRFRQCGTRAIKTQELTLQRECGALQAVLVRNDLAVPAVILNKGAREQVPFLARTERSLAGRQVDPSIMCR